MDSALLAHHWPVRRVQIYLCYGMAVVGGRDNRQRVKVMMTESRKQLIKIFLPTRPHDITLNCVERRGYLKICSSQHHLLLLPVTKNRKCCFLLFVHGIFPKCYTISVPKIFIPDFSNNNKIKVIIILNVKFDLPFVFSWCVLFLLALDGALPAQYKTTGFPFAIFDIDITHLSILGMALSAFLSKIPWTGSH